MSPFDYVKLALSRYTDFSGRSRRMEYWMFVVFNIVVSFVAQLIGGIVLLVFMFLEGTKGDNQYGPDPKGVSQI